MQLKQGRFSIGFVPLMLGVGALTFLLHELAHWLAGAALGYSMVFGVNQVVATTPTSPVHALLISAAGPAFTCLQAFVGYVWVKARAAHTGFALLYMAFFMRLMAQLISVFNPNDEARISRDLGLGMGTLPVIVVGVLFWMLLRASQHLRLTFRDQLLCYLTASAVVTCFVLLGR